MWNWREEKKLAEKVLDQTAAGSKGDAATSVIFAESEFTRLTTCGEINQDWKSTNSAPNLSNFYCS